DPVAYVAPPALRAFFVNYLRVTFEPLPDLEVTAHYWVAESHVLAGQFTLVNRDPERPTRAIKMALAGLLKPSRHRRLARGGCRTGRSGRASARSSRCSRGRPATCT
ncbi:MAG TPA: hypothetical protein PK954_19410, partial [Anaerolineales bacterium]|nr:hypothetical protein [Anaerolineales bacterium]